jgi:L-seryl-tRNA(Ser) seleniumtransferase
MNRGAALSVDDVTSLTSHVPFFAKFEGEAEPVAILHMGGEPSRHDALILNRVSAANFAVFTTLLSRQDRVVALAPAGGTTHPSVRRPIEMVGAAFEEVHGIEALEQALTGGAPPRFLVITPISASKRHLDLASVSRALVRPRNDRTLAYVDDAHMASRVGFFNEPRTFSMGDVDLAVCSTDKHVAGPRAGVLVGRRDLIATIRSRAYELGLEAQAGQYVGVFNALRDFDPKPIAEAGELARELLVILEGRYGKARVYLGGPGVAISGEDALDIARELRGGTAQPALVPVEASAVVAMHMLAADGLLTIAAVAMPGSAPVVRLMMYPDGCRLGAARIAASLDGGMRRLADMLHDVDGTRRFLLG